MVETSSPDNKIFLKELKRVYFEIDKYSDHLWSHKEVSEFIRGKRLRKDVTESEKAASEKW